MHIVSVVIALDFSAVHDPDNRAEAGSLHPQDLLSGLGSRECALSLALGACLLPRWPLQRAGSPDETLLSASKRADLFGHRICPGAAEK